MGRSSRTSILKRQRELRKAEKAAEKRARRHGKTVERATEPRPTLDLANLPGARKDAGDDGDSSPSS